ncbi:MAG TPA: MAPEG family protein [Solimonas sp.]|nr:MAPEG family protein [Solimonas sp.]
MQPFFSQYVASLAGMLCLAGLMFVQFLVADISGIRAKHVPGMPVTGGHADFLFRATRALANTNENIGLFLLIVLCGILLGANPAWMATGVWLFVVARAVHMGCYYADLRTLRSAGFTLGALAQLALLVIAALALRR